MVSWLDAGTGTCYLLLECCIRGGDRLVFDILTAAHIALI